MTSNQAIEYCYRHHYGYLYACAFNICERWDMSEDLVQDGFIRALTSPAKFSSYVNARKYIYICIRHAAFERLGKEARQRAMIRDFVHSDPARRISLEVQVAINFSKIKCTMSRVILREIYFYNKTKKEIRREYSISKNVVNQLHNKGLSQLSKLIL